MWRAVRGSTPILAPEKPLFQKVYGPFAALPHPPPAEMYPPANRLAHRHRPAAAGTDITLVGGRRGEFTRSKIAVNDLVVGVARDATADCAFRANDLLAFARDQHVTGSLLHAFSGHHQNRVAAERPRCSPRRPTQLGLVGDGRRRNAGGEPVAGGSPRSALSGRGGCRAGTARPLAGACRDARLPPRGGFDAADRSIGPLREAGVADWTAIARREHRVSFSISRRYALSS